MAGRVAFARVCFPEAKRPMPRCPRIVAVLLLQTLLAVGLLFPRPAAADPVKGSVSAAVENGFARLIFTLGNDVESQVRVANNIVIISFDRPVDVNVDHIRDGSRDYIGAARRDPDGKAVRLALTRRVTMNSMAAGDRLFVDLLPDTWSGLPPGLPREVIEELARRARDAEKKLRQEHVGRCRPQGAVDPGPDRQPADLHALHVPIAGADQRCGGQPQGQADADLQRDAQLRPV